MGHAHASEVRRVSRRRQTKYIALPTAQPANGFLSGCAARRSYNRDDSGDGHDQDVNATQGGGALLWTLSDDRRHLLRNSGATVSTDEQPWLAGAGGPYDDPDGHRVATVRRLSLQGQLLTLDTFNLLGDSAANPVNIDMARRQGAHCASPCSNDYRDFAHA